MIAVIQRNLASSTSPGHSRRGRLPRVFGHGRRWRCSCSRGSPAKIWQSPRDPSRLQCASHSSMRIHMQCGTCGLFNDIFNDIHVNVVFGECCWVLKVKIEKVVWNGVWGRTIRALAVYSAQWQRCSPKFIFDVGIFHGIEPHLKLVGVSIPVHDATPGFLVFYAFLHFCLFYVW